MKISPLAGILCLSCTLGLVLASPGVGAQAAPKASVEMTASRLTIRTERLEATFEKGSLISARNRLTNEAFARTDSPAGTQLLYKHHPALGVEDAEDVRLTRLSPTSGRFDLAWPDGSKASTTVAVDADTAEVVVTQEGRSAQPNLKGIAWSADGFSADLDVIVPGRSGIRFRKPFVSHHESLDWPMGWEIQFVILESRRDAARSGLWIRSDDTDMRFKALAIDFSDESVDLAFESHNPAPWETQSDVQSVRWRIDAYRGDWTVPAMQYRRWAEKAYGLVPLQEQPGRAKDVRAVVITGGYPEMLHTLAKTVDPKSVLLYVPGWRKDGMIAIIPSMTRWWTGGRTTPRRQRNWAMPSCPMSTTSDATL